MSKLDNLFGELNESKELNESDSKKPSLAEFRKVAEYTAEHVFMDAFWRQVDKKYRVPDHLYRKPELGQLKSQFSKELASVILRHFKRLYKDV